MKHDQSSSDLAFWIPLIMGLILIGALSCCTYQRKVINNSEPIGAYHVKDANTH